VNQTSDLKGKTALVTGAGKGIGTGIALALAQEGANVIVNYRSSEKGAREVAEKIRSLGAEALVVQADVSIREEVDRLCTEGRKAFGAIDILVNNAALQKDMLFTDYPDDVYRRIMKINLKGYWYCMQAVIPDMKRKQWGRIINISSIHGKRPTDFDTVYAMSKGGIKMLTREAALELGSYNITVNALEPGGVDIGKKSEHDSNNVFGKYTMEQMQFFRSIPRPDKGKGGMRTRGTIEEVGYAAAFLASPRAAFINGSGLRMDGGSTLL
jgi:glucose 1-dehydrogenase